MKKLKQLALPGIILVLLLSSCSVEKGIYLSGYHFGSRNKNHNHKEQSVENTKTNEIHSESIKKDSTIIGQTSEQGSVKSEIVIDNTASTNNLIYISGTPKVEWHQNNTTASLESNEIAGESRRSIKTYKKSRNAVELYSDDKQLHWAAISSLVTAILGSGVLAIIFSTIAIVSITEKEKYSGIGISVAAFLLGVIKITLIVLLVAF